MPGERTWVARGDGWQRWRFAPDRHPPTEYEMLQEECSPYAFSFGGMRMQRLCPPGLPVFGVVEEKRDE